MAPPRHDEDASASQRPSSSTNSDRNSIASRSSDVSSLSDIQVADGFRHNPNASDFTSSSSTITSHDGVGPFADVPPESPTDRATNMRNRPSSVAKPHRPHESLTLRHEHSSSGNAQPSFPRASIASSEGPIIRPDSPYRGPTGPSHPYQMYPQRTLSNATAETTAPLPHEPSIETRRQGPTHPYTLYTQSTAEVEQTPSRTIPVGFNNRPDNYQRQLGPDGEEAGDLIGPLGHTEELPPYTRYPEIAYVRKGSSNDTDSISTPSSSTSTQGLPAVAPGAGGLGRATRDPEFSSTEEDLAINRSRPSIRSQHSQVSRHNINTAAREISEKSGRQEKWEKRARKKLWGIVPYWAICLVMVGMVLMGIIMGAVIGTVLKKSDDKTRKAIAESEAPAPKTPVGEVIPYTVLPGDLDEIRIGRYTLPPLDKDEAPRKCFNNSLEFNAWSCDIPSLFYFIDITQIKNASKLAQYDLKLNAFNKTAASFIWGSQPPSVPKAIPLKLVNDTFDMGRGPAWWLNVTYNKTVIVPENNFPLPERRLKRGWDYDEYPASYFDPTQLGRASRSAVVGDKPWICTWPDTTLEIFIYPNVNASLAVPENDPNDDIPDYEQPTPENSSELPPAYPKAVKFLERRLSGDPDSTAACRQVIIAADGSSYDELYDSNGKPIRVEIIETASAWEEQAVANQKRQVTREWFDSKESHHSLARRDAQELTSCGCLWWST
ncbi:hypothetical protein CC79DRAFT_1194800 [Sarocladium strictum]